MSVLRGPFRRIDHEVIDRNLLCIEAQSKLFLKHVIEGFTGLPREFDVVGSFQSGLVDEWAKARKASDSIDKLRDRHAFRDDAVEVRVLSVDGIELVYPSAQYFY